MSGGDVGVGKREVLHRLAVGDLVLQRPVVALEHRDEQRQGQKRVGPHLEQRDVVLLDERASFVVGEGEPGRALAAVTVEERVGHLLLPPRHGAGGIGPVSLDQFGIAVDGVEELVEKVLAHDNASRRWSSLSRPDSSDTPRWSSLSRPDPSDTPCWSSLSRPDPSGYHVKYASIVWNRSSESV